MEGKKAKKYSIVSAAVFIKKLWCTSAFIEQGDIPGRKQTQEGKQYEEENNSKVRNYHVDYEADYYNVYEGDQEHEECNNVRHPADLPNMTEDCPEIECFAHIIFPCKTYTGGHDNQPGKKSNDDKNNRSHENSKYQTPDCSGIYRRPYHVCTLKKQETKDEHGYGVD